MRWELRQTYWFEEKDNGQTKISSDKIPNDSNMHIGMNDDDCQTVSDHYFL